MNDGDIYRPAAGLGEIGMQVSTWLAMTIGLEHVRARTGASCTISARASSRLAHSSAIVFGLGHAQQSAGHRRAGRRPVLQLVLLGYGMPAVLMAILARDPRHAAAAVLRRRRRDRDRAGARLSHLEVRTLFHGPVLAARSSRTPSTTPIRRSGSPSAWRCCSRHRAEIAAGAACLGGGGDPRPSSRCSSTTSPACRASTARCSFIGLGLVLIGIGWLYQRLLFPRRTKSTGLKTRYVREEIRCRSGRRLAVAYRPRFPARRVTDA